jgi:hypothetical protein
VQTVEGLNAHLLRTTSVSVSRLTKKFELVSDA